MSEPVDQLVCRDGERPRVWVRMNRFYRVGDDWYFSTRDSDDAGPFSSHREAEAALANYVACVYDDVCYEQLKA